MCPLSAVGFCGTRVAPVDLVSFYLSKAGVGGPMSGYMPLYVATWAGPGVADKSRRAAHCAAAWRAVGGGHLSAGSDAWPPPHCRHPSVPAATVSKLGTPRRWPCRGRCELLGGQGLIREQLPLPAAFTQ